MRRVKDGFSTPTLWQDLHNNTVDTYTDGVKDSPGETTRRLSAVKATWSADCVLKGCYVYPWQSNPRSLYYTLPLSAGLFYWELLKPTREHGCFYKRHPGQSLAQYQICGWIERTEKAADGTSATFFHPPHTVKCTKFKCSSAFVRHSLVTASTRP